MFQALMPEWLTWTLVGLGAWLAVSAPVAFLAGHVLSRRPARRRRIVILAGPMSARLRTRDRPRTVTMSS
jgi:hypothetical protein